MSVPDRCLYFYFPIACSILATFKIETKHQYTEYSYENASLKSDVF